MRRRLVHHGLEHSARRHPDKTVLVCDDRRVSYAELDEAANRLAHVLLAAGVVPGDRVAVLLENSVESVTAVFGVLKAGAAFTLVSPTMKSDKLARVMADERAAALITVNDGPRRKVVEAMDPAQLPRVLVWVGGPPSASSPGLDWETQLAQAPATAPDVTIGPDHIGTIIYTSGTTGDPKGVVSRHRDMVFAATAINSYLRNTEADVIFSALPLAFTYGLYQLITATTAGATLVLEKSFMFPGRELEIMAREKVTAFPGVPTLFNLILRLDNLASYDLGSLRYFTNAAAPLPVPTLQRLREAFPQAQLFSMYGQTECKRALYLPPAELDRRPDSVGIPLPGTDAYVVDEQGRRVPPGTVGELVLRGGHLMAGYWEKPELTAARLRPGPRRGEVVMYTGDLFRADADGYLYFVSRADDIIKTRGEKVSPHEVESALRSLPGVADVAAVGVPDEMYGEAVKVYVVRADGSTLTERDVRAFCLQHLEDFMVPKYVDFCAELPTSENGKTLRRQLRSQVA